MYSNIINKGYAVASIQHCFSSSMRAWKSRCKRFPVQDTRIRNSEPQKVKNTAF